MAPCVFLQIIQDESDRFHQFKPTDSAKIAKVYGITPQKPKPEHRKTLRTAESAERQKGQKAQKGAERDFLGQSGQKNRCKARRLNRWLICCRGVVSRV